MKHFYKIAAVIGALLLLLTSCMKDPEGTYKYSFAVGLNVANEQAQQDLEKYFDDHVNLDITFSFTGKRSETDDKAIDKLIETVKTLDSDFIISKLSTETDIVYFILQREYDKDAWEFINWVSWTYDSSDKDPQ